MAKAGTMVEAPPAENGHAAAAERKSKAEKLKEKKLKQKQAKQRRK